MRPRVNVVMPVRDGGATVRAAVEGLLRQTIAEVEVVVIEDGSRDDTPTILAALARDEPRLEVISTSGIGIGPALGLGLVECRAPFVARMDADDLCAPERLEAQVAFLEANPEVVLCGTHVTIAGLGGEPPGGHDAARQWIGAIRTPEDVRRELWVECPILHPTFCFRREEVVRAGGYRAGPFPEDYELVLRLAARGHAMANVPRELVTWRDSATRASRVLPAYSRDAFFRLKAEWLALTRLAARPAIVWGAGKVGRFVARELLRAGVEKLAGFVDIDPLKWGRTVRERPVWRPEELLDALAREPRPLVLGAVGTLGARALIREALAGLGLAEVEDFVMVA
ncbi:MAG: glycosyltransferase [Deltaproteobacteria bacterium]|nr:glycosyltransferase [Deltaproteobacteria bacterium]